MRLDLREIISMPGRSIPFSFEVDVADLWFDCVKSFSGPVLAEGTVRNRAGSLEVEGRITGQMICQCARCLKEFSKELDLDMPAYLAEELQDEDDEETYLLDGNEADMGEIATTALVLGMEQRMLCREDCKGLCERCGKDLNDGPCDCGVDQDPRLAVLGQLLEKN